MKKPLRSIGLAASVMLGSMMPGAFAQNATATPATTPLRERLLMDEGWKFALGHANGGARDFDAIPAGTAFNYFTKAARAEGAAAPEFDDSGWHLVNLPHDWAVALPFDARGSHSHGYKALGKNFPENSIGWYRRKFDIPASNLGKRISLEFEGVFRDSQVWVNGFYLGRESSGYTSFGYDISDYLNYGGENVVAVRADASLEEGWFYEGAGIYRHVWMVKAPTLHIPMWGTFVTSDVADGVAVVTARVTVKNDSAANATFDILNEILDADGNPVASNKAELLSLKPGEAQEFSASLNVENPKIWSLETPNMHKLVTTIFKDGKVIDRYETPFGIRTIRWDAKEGFFLNGQHVVIKGTNNHQDFAGVGAAMSDSLNAQRIEILKEMGCNAYRTSHNPPTPAMLDACDRLGMLVLDENRETGINEQQLGGIRDMILRDRNHPCIILWSIGNEEWAIEGNDKGARVTQTMQNFAKQFDTTRPYTCAISGGWGGGSSSTVEVMGFNYFNHGDDYELGMDHFHAKYPDKPSVGTEEGASFTTRGIYEEDRAHCRLTAYDIHKEKWFVLAEESVSHYAARPWAAGQFRWTGFDYRGEPSPFGWPAIATQFGVMDTCGFAKDTYFYYQAAWTDKPVLHLFPHWNWAGKEGKEIDVWVFGNVEEVALELNGKIIGRKTMPTLGHLEWKVPYEAGTLVARGFKDGRQILTDKVETTGAPASVQLTPRTSTLAADGDDVSLVTVEVLDAEGRRIPTADNLVRFDISGPAKIVGVGNGDPVSHEADKYADGQQWQRSLFNGLALVIIQTERGKTGAITLSARAEGLAPASVKLTAASATLCPSVPLHVDAATHATAPVPVLVEVNVPAKKASEPVKK
jgi:beta-galactosidase